MIFGDDEDDEDVLCFEADMTVVAAASALEDDDDANTGEEVLEGVLPDGSWPFAVHRRKIKQIGL